MVPPCIIQPTSFILEDNTYYFMLIFTSSFVILTNVVKLHDDRSRYVMYYFTIMTHIICFMQFLFTEYYVGFHVDFVCSTLLYTIYSFVNAIYRSFFPWKTFYDYDANSDDKIKRFIYKYSPFTHNPPEKLNPNDPGYTPYSGLNWSKQVYVLQILIIIDVIFFIVRAILIYSDLWEPR